MSWVAVALALVSAGATAYNTNRTAKKQDAAAARGIRQQAENQRQANAKLNKTLEFAEKSKPEEARKRTQQQYQQALRAQAPAALQGLQRSTGGAAFNDAAGAAQTQATNYGDLISNLMARMDAPDLQRQAEANAYGNLGMDLDVIGGNVRGDQFLNNLRVGSIRRNPWIDAGAQVAGGAAQGYAANGGAWTGSQVPDSLRYSYTGGDLPQTLEWNRYIAPATGRRRG